MAQLTREEKVFIVLNYTRTQRSTAVENAFQARFPGRNPPAPSTILRNVQKYLNAGTSLNLLKAIRAEEDPFELQKILKLSELDLLQQNFERSNSRVHLTVWAAVCGNGLIIGPYFFDGNVNGNAYLRIQCLTTTACLHSMDSVRYAQVHNALY